MRCYWNLWHPYDASQVPDVPWIHKRSFLRLLRLLRYQHIYSTEYKKIFRYRNRPNREIFENKQHKLSISPLNSNSQSCELMNNLATKLEGHRWMLHEPISDYILVESRVLVMLTHTCILLYWRAQSSIVIIGRKCPSLWKHEIQFIFELRATAKFRKKNPVLHSNNTIFPLCSSWTCFGKMKISLSVLERARVSTLCAAHQFSFHINSTNRPIGADGRRQRT